MRRGDSHWIKIIVSKLAGGVLEFGSIAKVGSVGVPLRTAAQLATMAFSGATNLSPPNTGTPLLSR
ncbi:MAG: hypothetical protein EBQ58_01495 [Betaproteobacteria bacterium]|nr:hypothetical protein [Betaproteobacteria bacterium]